MPTLSTSVLKTLPNKTAKRHSPYDSASRRTTNSSITKFPSSKKQLSEAVRVAPSPPSPSSLTTSTSSSPTSTCRRTSVRTACLETVRKVYPYYTPRNDWEILLLSSGPYNGPPSGMHEFIDDMLAGEIAALGGTLEIRLAQAKKMLDGVADPTGRKPRPGDPDVFVQPIPKSKYSIRLFPGSEKYADYCLDFVRTDTGKAVNSPFQFDLFCVASLQAPAPTGRVARMRPLECAFGYTEAEIRPGEEKFLLSEGRTYVLRRRGHRDVRFTVPIRQREKPTPPPVDADILQFPQYI